MRSTFSLPTSGSTSKTDPSTTRWCVGSGETSRTRRSYAIRTDLGFTSMPMEFLPSFRASTFVVPEPQNGSNTVSPLCENRSMNFLGTSGMKRAGCDSFQRCRRCTFMTVEPSFKISSRSKQFRRPGGQEQVLSAGRKEKSGSEEMSTLVIVFLLALRYL